MNKCYLNLRSHFHELNTEHRSISKSQHTTEYLWDHLCRRPVSDVAPSTSSSEACHAKAKACWQQYPLRKQLALLGIKSPCVYCLLKALGFCWRKISGFIQGVKHHLFSCLHVAALWGSRNQLSVMGLLMEGLAFHCQRASRACLHTANMSHGWETWKSQGPQFSCHLVVWHFVKGWFKGWWGVVVALRRLSVFLEH